MADLQNKIDTSQEDSGKYAEASIETLFEELDTVSEKLSDKDVSLEDAFSLYQKGMHLIKACNDKIDHAEKQMKILEEQDA